jgi:hypothetical protein
VLTSRRTSAGLQQYYFKQCDRCTPPAITWTNSIQSIDCSIQDIAADACVYTIKVKRRLPKCSFSSYCQSHTELAFTSCRTVALVVVPNTAVSVTVAAVSAEMCASNAHIDRVVLLLLLLQLLRCCSAHSGSTTNLSICCSTGCVAAAAATLERQRQRSQLVRQ